MTTRSLIGCLLAILIGLTGCAEEAETSRVTQENFNQLKEGMTTDDVQAILGEPTEVKRADIPMVATASYRYADEKNNRIELTFFNNKLTTKKASFTD